MAPIGFFDLPLELRQQIYRDCMPRNVRGEVYAPLNGHHDSLSCLRKADPQIACELQDEERVHGTKLAFLVRDTYWEPPKPTHFPNVESLFITFDQYEFEQRCAWDLDFDPDRSWCEKARSHNEPKLATMYHNFRRFIRWWKQSNDKALDWFFVDFLGREYDDHRWCQDHGTEFGWESDGWESDGDLIEPPTGRILTLATREAAPGRVVSVVESLLMPLKEFPIVKNAGIMGPCHISLQAKLYREGINTPFDGNYLHNVERAWEEWLEGKRDISWRKRFNQLQDETK